MANQINDFFVFVGNKTDMFQTFITLHLIAPPYFKFTYLHHQPSYFLFKFEWATYPTLYSALSVVMVLGALVVGRPTYLR